MTFARVNHGRTPAPGHNRPTLCPDLSDSATFSLSLSRDVQALPPFTPTCVSLPRDQLDWLDTHAAAQRISRSALVRQAVDALIQSRTRRAHADG
jgi:hypothetical protein